MALDERDAILPPSSRLLEELGLKQQRLDNAEALAGFGSWDWDLAGGESRWSDQLFAIYGRDKALGVPHFDAWQETIHPEDLDRLATNIRASMAGETRYNIEFRIYAKDTGALKYINSRGISRVDAQGQVIGIWGVDQDVTPARHAAAALATALRRGQQILSSLNEGILLVNNDGVVEYANQGFCDLFCLGQSPQSLMGVASADLLDLIGGRYADPLAHRAHIQRLVERGTPVRDEEVRVVGDATLLRDFIPLVVDNQEAGRLWVHRDITASKHAEQVLQASLRDKDALLKEVHHRVKNNLQVITSLLRLEGARSPQPGTRAVLGDMQGRIRTMALLHESLYRAGTLASVELGAYLGQLAAHVFRAQLPDSAQVRLRLDMAEVWVGMDHATPCGLIVNELLSNSLKHGFPDGRSGEVCLVLHVEPGSGMVHLAVRDTGVGLPPDFDALRTRSLGVQLVSDLAGQVDGTLHVGLPPGASFEVRFPADGAQVPQVAGGPA